MKIKIKKKLGEVSSAIGISGAAGGFIADDDLKEMYSSSGTFGSHSAKPEDMKKVHDGNVERNNVNKRTNKALSESPTTKPELDFDLDDIDNEFFDENPDGIDVDATANLDPQQAVNDTLQEKGFRIEQELGKGMNGTVYLGKNNLNQPVAIKVVFGTGATREEENYRIIGNARKMDPLIEKHFPNVYDSWTIGDKASVIVMEVLSPLTDEQSTFVPDAGYLSAKNKPYRLAAAGDLYSDPKDLSNRYSLYFQNNPEKVSQKFDYHVYQLVTDWDGDFLGKTSPEYVEKLKADVTTDELNKLYRMGYGTNKNSINTYLSNRKRAFEQTLGADSSAVEFIEILEKDAPKALGANAALIEVAFNLMIAGLAAGKNKRVINDTIGEYARSILIQARSYTGIPTRYDPRELSRDDKSHERRFASSKGLHAAIKALYSNTGLVANDVHDQNVMSKKNGDLVIVDVGLFNKDPSWNSDKNLQEIQRFRKKMLRNLQK
jgi:hypothetical protein